jgi:hypothetical protein
MIHRRIEAVEVIVFRLDFRPDSDLKAYAYKDVQHLLRDLQYGMHVSHGGTPAWQGEVYLADAGAFLGLARLECLLASFNGLGYFGFDLVGYLADGGPFGFGQARKAPQDFRKPAFPAQVLYAGLLQSLQLDGFSHFVTGVLLDLIELIFHERVLPRRRGHFQFAPA